LVAGSAQGGSGGRAIAKGTAISEQQQPGTPHRPDSKLSAPAAHSPSKWRDIASTVCVVLVGLALLDAAVETYVAGAPIRLAVVLAVLVFLALLGLLWKRMQSTTKAISSLFFLLLLVGAAAWLPGGLERGIVMARQPTSAVLVAITGLTVLAAGVWFVRVRIPWWLRAVGVALAVYGVSAFVLAVLTRQPYAALFHGHSFWEQAPFWLQGSYIGLAVIPLAIVADIIAVLGERRSIPAPQWRWQLDLSLAIAVLIAAAAFVPHPRWLMPGGGLSSEGKDAVINGNSKNPAGVFDVLKPTVSKGESGTPANSGSQQSEALPQNMDLAALEAGGHVESCSSQYNDGRVGNAPFGDRKDTALGLIVSDPEAFWLGKRGGALPQEIVLSFFRREPALISAVILNPGTDEEKAGWAKDIEIWTSTTNATEGFSKTAGATLRPERVDQRIDFAPVEARYVKLRILSSQAASQWVSLGKLKVLEAQRPGYTPIRERDPALAAMLRSSLQSVATAPSSDVAVPGASMTACAPTPAPASPGRHSESENVLVVESGNTGEYNEYYPPLKLQQIFQDNHELHGVSDPSIYSHLKFRHVKPREASPFLLADDIDTVVLAQLCDIKTSVSQSFKNALLAWVGQGYKLIVQDADSCGGSMPDYGFLPYRLATSNPGAKNAGSDRLLFVEENTLGNAQPADVALLNLESWLKGTDGNHNEIGDSNTIVQYDPHWCGHLFGTNRLKKNGFMEAYFHYGRGLVIYDGFDKDQHDSPVYRQLVTRELAQPFDPDNLPCSAHLGDFVITTTQQLKEQPMVPGRTYTYPLTLLSNQGYKGTIKLAITSTPPDPSLTERFEPETVELSEISNSTLTVTTTASSPPSLHTLAVRGTDQSNKSNAVCLSLKERKTGGLQIVAETDPRKAMAARNIEIILDCSGSMLSRLGKSTRIGTARQVLRDVLAKIPDDFNVGLRVYANRYSWKDMQHSCTDTQLLLPIQKLDRQRILSTVDSLKPRGDTPLVYSVLQTPADLKAVGGGSVIVITDGQETCHGDTVKAAAELKASGFPMTLNIVGFTLKGKEKQDVERLMSPFAEATGGHYYYAENGEALARAVSQAALNKFPYEVFNSSGQQVAKGEAGASSAELQPGDYKVVVHAGDQELTERVTVTIKTDTVLKVARKGNQFVLEHMQGQTGEPAKTATTSQAQP